MTSRRLFDERLARASGRCSSPWQMVCSLLRRTCARLFVVLLAALLLLPLRNVASAASGAAPDDIVLVQGATYRARLKLSFLQCLASRDRIGRKLGKGGFSGVRVYMSARELPPDWPAPFRSRAGGCERYAEGIWARATIPRKRPSSIESWWVARPSPPAPRSEQ